MLESLTTNPALNFLTRSTIPAWSAIGWETKMKAIPPARARAMAMAWSDTDCMIAELKGMASWIAASWPFAYRTSGVESETDSAEHSLRVRLGIRRYSLNVCDGFGIVERHAGSPC